MDFISSKVSGCFSLFTSVGGILKICIVKFLRDTYRTRVTYVSKNSGKMYWKFLIEVKFNHEFILVSVCDLIFSTNLLVG